MDTALVTPQVKPSGTAIVVSPYKWARRVASWESCPQCRENLDERLKRPYDGLAIIHCENCGTTYMPLLPF